MGKQHRIHRELLLRAYQNMHTALMRHKRGNKNVILYLRNGISTVVIATIINWNLANALSTTTKKTPLIHQAVPAGSKLAFTTALLTGAGSPKKVLFIPSKQLQSPPSETSNTLDKAALEKILWPDPSQPNNHDNLIDQIVMQNILNAFQPDQYVIPMTIADTAIIKAPATNSYNKAVINSFPTSSKIRNIMHNIQRDFTQLTAPIMEQDPDKLYKVKRRKITQYPTTQTASTFDYNQYKLDEALKNIANIYIQHTLLGSRVSSCIESYAEAEDLGTPIDKMSHSNKKSIKAGTDHLKPHKTNRAFELVLKKKDGSKNTKYRLGCSSSHAYATKYWNGWNDIYEEFQNLIKHNSILSTEDTDTIKQQDPTIASQITELNSQFQSIKEKFEEWSIYHYIWENLRKARTADQKIEKPEGADAEQFLNNVIFNIEFIADTSKQLLTKLLLKKYQYNPPSPLNMFQLTQKTSYSDNCATLNGTYSPLDQMLYSHEPVFIKGANTTQNKPADDTKENLDNMLLPQITDPLPSIDNEITDKTTNKPLITLRANGQWYIMDTGGENTLTPAATAEQPNPLALTFKHSDKALTSARAYYKIQISKNKNPPNTDPSAEIILSVFKNIWAKRDVEFDIYLDPSSSMCDLLGTCNCRLTEPMLEDYMAKFRFSPSFQKLMNPKPETTKKDPLAAFKYNATVSRQQAYIKSEKLLQLHKLSLKLDDLILIASIKLLNHMSFIKTKQSTGNKTALDLANTYIDLYRFSQKPGEADKYNLPK